MPYDITAWTMPLYLGVEVTQVAHAVAGPLKRVEVPLPPAEAPASLQAAPAVVIPAAQLAAYTVANRAMAHGRVVRRVTAATTMGGVDLAPGSIVLSDIPDLPELLRDAGAHAVALTAAPSAVRSLRPVTVGVYHPWFGLEDAGWCRWVLERAGFTVTVVDNRSISSGAFARDLDVLVLPPITGKTLVEGQSQRLVELPQEYRGGIGKNGVEAVKQFVAGGGTAIAFAASAEWLAETLDAPVSNTLKGVGREEYLAPGALLEMRIDTAAPLGWGMPARAAALVDAATVFETRPAADEAARSVAARFADSPLLLSGWVRGEEKLRRRAAVVEVRSGTGRAVLFSFAPYFRGQTEGTFALLYNTVMLEMMDEGDRR